MKEREKEPQRYENNNSEIISRFAFLDRFTNVMRYYGK